jgi:hypothetical protein
MALKPYPDEDRYHHEHTSSQYFMRLSQDQYQLLFLFTVWTSDFSYLLKLSMWLNMASDVLIFNDLLSYQNKYPKNKNATLSRDRFKEPKGGNKGTCGIYEQMIYINLTNVSNYKNHQPDNIALPHLTVRQ